MHSIEIPEQIIGYTQGPRCITLFVIEKLWQIFIQIAMDFFFAGVSRDFAVKNSGKSFMQRGPGSALSPHDEE